jgi:hypothetical protein
MFNVQIGWGYGGGNAAITVPVHRCHSVYPVGTWGRKEIGIKFYGDYRGIVTYVDMAGDYTSAPGPATPIWADHAWVGVTSCSGAGCYLYEYLRKDSGW